MKASGEGGTHLLNTHCAFCPVQCALCLFHLRPLPREHYSHPHSAYWKTHSGRFRICLSLLSQKVAETKCGKEKELKIDLKRANLCLVHLGLWMKIQSFFDNTYEEYCVFPIILRRPTGSLQICISRGSSFKAIGLKSYLSVLPSVSFPPTKGCGGNCLSLRGDEDVSPHSLAHLFHTYPPFSWEGSGRSALKALESRLWTPPNILYWIPQIT